ncbi:MAG: cysteine--tRNA ligase [Patescibacteria group bacterium]
MLQIYNTLTGKKSEFKPINNDAVGMYVCGPTVYDYDHIGHARTYLSFDLLHRLLRHHGYSVNYIQNITDVGHLVNDAEVGADKIQLKAAERGQTPRQIAEHFTKAHLEDLKSLNILQPSVLPKASEHIQEIQDFISGLINAGIAYVTNHGNVYFAVSKDPDYGKLSHRGLTEILTGTRVESASDKRSAADFALWKTNRVNDPELTWDSPWGKGYPGWHIECSAMSRKYLGDTFDIHGSAVEHVFPHHENEIAQTESLTGQQMANYWVHTGMLTVDGKKMSKSLHNQVNVQDALKEYSANEIRLAFFQTHYRKPFDYTKEVMEQGKSLRRKLFQSLPFLPESAGEDLAKEIVAALSDDLDTPTALYLWNEHYKDLGQKETHMLFELLGIRYVEFSQNAHAQELAKQRDAARAHNDYLTADNRKAEIMQLGYEPVDTADGSKFVPR